MDIFWGVVIQSTVLKSLLSIKGKNNVCLEIQVKSNTKKLIMLFSKLIKEMLKKKENRTFVKRVFRNIGKSRLKDKHSGGLPGL